MLHRCFFLNLLPYSQKRFFICCIIFILFFISSSAILLNLLLTSLKPSYFCSRVIYSIMSCIIESGNFIAFD